MPNEATRPECTPLLHVGRVGRHHDVFVKDESAHPTGTFKDRLARVAIANTQGDVLFGSISYGNTALSFARACEDAASAKFVAFVPLGFRDWKLGPSSTGCFTTGRDLEEKIVSSGAAVAEVDLSTHVLDDDDLARLAEQLGLLAGRRFVNVTEGIDIPAYAAIAHEALDQIGDPPDVCVVQYGAGILANEIRDVFLRASKRTNVVAISTPHPRSLAQMLYGPIWVDVADLARRGVAMSRHKSPDRTGTVREPYPVYSISEDVVYRGLEIASQIGLSAEPSGSAGLGFLDELESVLPDYDPTRHRVLVINTGNGIDNMSIRRTIR